MTEVHGLARKLAEVTAALDWVKKRGTNEAQHYQYVMAEDIFADVRGELAKRHVQFLIDIEHSDFGALDVAGKTRFWSELRGRYSFVDGETGEVLTGGCVGYAQDSGDKAIWKAWTGMLKYVLRSVFLLPTGDDPENDGGEKPDRPTGDAGMPRPPRPVAVSGDAPKVRVGLTAAQQGKLRSRYRELGLETDDQMRQAGQNITRAVLGGDGLHSTREWTNETFDKVLDFLSDAESIGPVIAGVNGVTA